MLGFARLLPPANLQGRKYIAALGLLILLAGFASSFSNTQASKAELADQYVETALGKLELPVVIDEITSLEEIRADGGSVISAFSLEVPEGQSFDELVAVIEANVKENACSDGNLRAALDAGVSIVFQHQSVDQRPIAIRLPGGHCDDA